MSDGSTADYVAGAGRRDKCPLPGCGHALSMHNELGYCRSQTTPDRQGACVCDSTVASPNPFEQFAEASS